MDRGWIRPGEDDGAYTLNVPIGLKDYQDGCKRFFELAASIRFDMETEALIKLRDQMLLMKEEQERWRTDPLGLMWVFRFPELVMLSISGWSADALEAIANHLLTISSTIRRKL